MSKITYDDIFALIEEIKEGAKDKTRTIEDVSNSTVKNIILQESNMAIDKGVTTLIMTSAELGITGSAFGTLIGVGTGVVSTGLSSLGVTTVGVVAGGVAGATGGAVSGSVVPIVGTVVGLAVGLSIGAYAGHRKKVKENETKKRLFQESENIQNRIIRDLEIELAELKEKYGKAIEINERYRYIIGILTSSEELKNVVGASGV